MNPRSTKKLRIAAIVLGVLLIMLTIGWSVVSQNYINNGASRTAQEKLKQVLAGEQESGIRTVASKYGFTVRYDEDVFTALGREAANKPSSEAKDSKTYKDDELQESRGYSSLEIAFRQPSDTAKAEDNKISSKLTLPHLAISTSNAKKYFDRTAMPEKYKDTKKYSDLDLMAETIIQQLTEKDANAKYTVSDVTIAGKKFKKVEQMLLFHNGGEAREIGRVYNYMTVQNDRPYWFKLPVYTGSWAEEYAAQLESLIAGMTFQQPDESLLLSAKTGSIRLADTSASTAHKEQNDAPAQVLTDINADTLTGVIARNQIATVRIGSMRCADMRFTAANGTNFTLNNACATNIGSGSIITGHGHIATSGRVTEFADAALFEQSFFSSSQVQQQYYNFVVQAGYISQASLTTLLQQSAAGSLEAAAAILSLINKVPQQSIAVSNNVSEYIVQTSNDPIRKQATSSGRPKWVPSITNLKASKIDAEVDVNGPRLDKNNTKTDVAILKIDGSFPSVELGDTGSLQNNELLTTIGYPVVIDNSLKTTQTKSVPTAAQGNLAGRLTDAGGHKLFWMAQTSIVSNGAPTFDRNGKQVGLSTYGGAACGSSESDNSCLGQGLTRDIQDLKNIASRNGIMPSSNNEITRLWMNGLQEFSDGRYSKAKVHFGDLNKKYPGNYLVEKLLKISEETKDDYIDEQLLINLDDASSGTLRKSRDSHNTIVLIVMILLGTVGLSFIIVVITIIAIVIDNKKKEVAQPRPMPQSFHPQTPPRFQTLYQQQPGSMPQYPPQPVPGQNYSPLPPQSSQQPPQPYQQPPTPHQFPQDKHT